MEKGGTSGAVLVTCLPTQLVGDKDLTLCPCFHTEFNKQGLFMGQLLWTELFRVWV